MNKRLVLVLNGKGGVGKSFFAVNLVQFLKDTGVPHIAIDSDNENSTLNRFHSDARFLDLAGPRALDLMFHALDEVDLVVVDCRAASTDLLCDYFASIDLGSTAGALGVVITLAMPVNHEPDSVEQVQRIVREMGPIPAYAIIRNALHSQEFTLFDQSAVRQRLLRDLGGVEISLTRLSSWLVDFLNQENLTITPAAKSSKLHLLDRQRLLNWQRQLYAQLAQRAPLFLPPTPEASHANHTP